MPDKPRFIRQVERRLDERTAPGGPGDRKYAARSSGDDVAALRAEQEAENAQTLASGGPEHMTSGQWRGMVVGGLAGAAVGAVLMVLVFGFFPFMEPTWARVMLLAICGALGGAAAGGVYWAGRLPELEGETTDVEGRPSAGTTLRDAGTDARGR
jgi:hypothetical protein